MKSSKFTFNPILKKGDSSVRIIHIVFDVSPSTAHVHKESVMAIIKTLEEIKAIANKEGFAVYVAITEYSTGVYPVMDFTLLNTLDTRKIPFSVDVKREATNTGEALLQAKKRTMEFYNDMRETDSRMIRTPMIFLSSDGSIYPYSECLPKYKQAAREIKSLEHPENHLDDLVFVCGAMVDGDLSEFYELTHYKGRVIKLTEDLSPFLQLLKVCTCTKTNLPSCMYSLDNISENI